MISFDYLSFIRLLPQILRCDRRALQCGPALEIVLYVLKASLAASKTQLSRHLQETPMVSSPTQGTIQPGQVTGDGEREDLRVALVATQESAAVQILLEACLPAGENSDENVLISDLQECRSLICSYLHETFIADPTLAKLVHFQGYPLELLPVTVAGVPSMHICMDFAPELLSMPDIEKQVFAIDMISHLSVQYALPKSFSTARLAVNAMATLLTGKPWCIPS